MIRWQWHQLDRMQIICTSHHADKHPSTLPLSFLPARCPSCHPTDSVKALNAINALIVQLLSKAFIATKTPLFSDWQFGTKDNEIFTLEI